MTIQLKPSRDSQSETLLAFVGWKKTNGKKKILTHNLPKDLSKWLKRPIDKGIFSAEKKETFFAPYAEGKNHFLFVGLGDLTSVGKEEIKRASAVAFHRIKQEKLRKVDYLVSTSPGNKIEALESIVEGTLLSNYRFAPIRSQRKSSSAIRKSELLAIDLIVGSRTATHRKALERATILSECTNFARRLADTPPNYMTPAILASEAQKAAQKIKGLKVSVWNRERVKKERMGGLFGVSLGSYEEPRFIIMEYKGTTASKKPICFVGKGLTFDSGGLSLKPAGHMADMKYDMCGGANTIATVLAISRMKLKVNVLGLIPCSENVVGEKANRPSDVLIARNGISVEVLNTDAEGRLI